MQTSTLRIRLHFDKLINELQPNVSICTIIPISALSLYFPSVASLPFCKIFMTLHEYLAICNNLGQMIKRPTNSLCRKSTFHDCARCFPINLLRLFSRRMYLLKFLSMVDHFISPSEFLKQRYILWGLEEKRISVIENGLPPADSRARRVKKLYSGAKYVSVFLARYLCSRASTSL